MLFDETLGRWPSIYDAEGLKVAISKLISDLDLDPDLNSDLSYFYTDIINPEEPPFCQGDIVQIDVDFPFIDEDGEIAILDVNYKYWLILGNTCDLSRTDASDVNFTHIVPLENIPSDIEEDFQAGLKKYKFYKQFYLPKWDSSAQECFLNFAKICSIEKNLLTTKGSRVARLRQTSWVLLHSCLVRYLARDDGRHD